jgi:multiple sugar transport system permease protein
MITVAAVASHQRRRKTHWWKRHDRVFQIGATMALVVLVLFFVFPYYYMAISSMRPPFFSWSTTDLDLWPKVVSSAGYDAILTAELYGSKYPMGAVGALLHGLANTMFQEIFIVVGGTITSLLAAYAFAKFDFWGRNFIFYLLLSTMIIPGEITLVPKYVMFNNWGFINTHWALIVPAVLGAGGWFLMRMFLSTIPNAYVDAARIDGAGDFRIVWEVIAPLAVPVILTNALFTFLGVWNDLVGPMFYVNDWPKYTWQMVLHAIQSQWGFGGGIDDPVGTRMQTLFAGLVIGSVPTIILFAFLQRYITEGTIITGLKI